ncbi:MAG: phenylalanine--tRNA ligase subunit beta [Verrucomicrobiia bacterium]|jgi:phenylalanyl-tRNA synthetase beta chain
MKFTYNWLKQYVDFDWSPQELAEKLTFVGIEVEDIVSLGGGVLQQVVVCQVLSSEKHPNADKLTVCRVNDGTGERQIVCGAHNYKVGDKVPLALPGVTLPGNFTIKLAKLRGVESQGMMCAAEELGLLKGEDGLLILPAETPVGIKLSEAMGGADTVFDIEVTPNRPDWLSVIGIAREVSALTGNPLKLPQISLTESAESTESLTSVRLEAPDLCPRYTARVIRGVKIGPSPAWLKQVLEKLGMRAINNVVDVTNYVMMECGQPLHAFDYNLLGEHRIVVRRAVNGEQFVAIDDSKHELTNEMLVIADAARAVALAGVMGGKNSEINYASTDVLLESAWFLPSNVRKTSKKLGLPSEASYRFERGADIDGVVWASNRATQLIHQLAGGQIARGIVDALAKPVEKRRVKCRYAQVDRLLGIEVPPETVKKIFVGLGLSVVKDEPMSCHIEVPTFRVDLEREADLIEEVCRIYGVEKIPARMQPSNAAVSEFDGKWDAIGRVRQVLTALGFHEAMNQTLVSEGDLKLQNPLSADQQALRSSLVPGLLGNLRTNVSRHQFDVKLFEIGRVFAADGKESLHLALAVTGRRSPQSWETGAREAKLDYYDLKGALEELGVEAVIQQIPAAQAKKLDLRDAVFVAEMELEPLLASARGEKQFRELPKFPAVVRDVALVVDESIEHAAITAAIKKSQNKFLERVELFDIFRGGSIPTGKKSMAYSLMFRAVDRTLTDAEVNEAHERIKRQLQQALKCEIREG